MASVYDRRMEEIAAQRDAERQGLDRIAESTETINAGMSGPLVWILGIASIVLVPVTGGLSLGLAIIAILRATAGGKANIQAIVPTAADVTSPGPGCVRILAALGSLAILVVLVLLLLAAIAYNMGVKP